MPDDTAIHTISRPHRDLMTYYVLVCVVFPPAFPFLIIPAYFRYHTMRYRFTNEGISMSWGILFRREIIINYARIQDIHLRSNFVERWLGLARVLVQTASGNAGAEMTLEGLKEFEAVRDFLYTRMQGVKDAGPAGPSSPGPGTIQAEAELAAVLREVALALRETRIALQAAPNGGSGKSNHV